MTLSQDASLAETGGGSAAPGLGAHPAARGRLRKRAKGALNYLGTMPFLVYVGVFLFWPTYLVVSGAFQNNHGHASLANIRQVGTGNHLHALWETIQLSLGTAIAGAILGGLLAWAIAEGNPNGVFRRMLLSMSGVLAQFGGVMLAFAFLATYGYTGLVTKLLQTAFKLSPFSTANWIYTLFGLGVVYTFFQIPLMVLIFLPSLDGLQPQWREASDNLGGGLWAYWRHVAGPILAPSFVGAWLLLFVNSFSAYATAASLLSQGSPITPLEIRQYIESELSVNTGLAKSLAFTMVVVVIIVMTLYALVQRRAAKWKVK
jgi:putative spermidine/putrescine transport system permease protein